MSRLIRALCPALFATLLALPVGAQTPPGASEVQQAAPLPAPTRTARDPQRTARRAERQARIRAERAAATPEARRAARTERVAMTAEQRRAARAERARLAQERAAREGGTLQAPAGMRPVR
jgi:hypothetical protein